MPRCLPPVPTGGACCAWCREPIGDDPDFVLVAGGMVRTQWWHMGCRDELFRLEADGVVSIYESPVPVSSPLG
jgi:hypothetical protein